MDPERSRRFEALALPSMGAAYNLARWMTRNAADAEDVVQEAFLRAFKFFDGYQGGDPRAWLLQIVRNTACTWLAANRRTEQTMREPDPTGQTPYAIGPWDPARAQPQDPAELIAAMADAERVRHAIEKLPADYREVLVLREFEGLSYREIAAVVSTPIGTVMSRLARARDRLATSFLAEEGQHT